MPLYKYKGVKTTGQNVSGVIESDGLKNARNQLKKQGVYVTRILEEKTGHLKQKNTFSSGKIKDTDITMMTRQFSTLINANVPVVDTLDALAGQVENEKLKMILFEVKQKVNEGASIYDGLKPYESIFSSLYINMLRAGESSGTLGLVLERLAEYTEKQMNLKNKLVSSLAYPVLMMIISVVIIALLFIVVIPKITTIFDSMETTLPIYTQILISISNFIKENVLILILVVAVSIYVLKRYLATDKGKAVWDKIKLKLPLFGKIVRMTAVSQFARTLATLHKAGVPLLQSLEIVQSVVDNVVFRDILKEAKIAVSEGQSLAKILGKSGEFPSIVVQMVQIGEKTGELGEMLEHISSAYDIEVESKLETLTSLLEPIMIVFMGGFVGFIVVAILMPIMQMSSGIN